MSDLIASDDRGLTLGVGLFETVLVEASRPVLWTAHLDRLARGCAALNLPAPDRAACAEAAVQALAAAGLQGVRAALRLTWTGGSGPRGLAGPAQPSPRLLASAAAAAPRPAAFSLATSSVRRNPSSPTSRLKTLSYLDNVAARREALAIGADEALMLSQDGTLACAAAANLFWLNGDTLFTPALDRGVLDGVVRAAAMREAGRHGLRLREVAAKPDVLAACDGVFLTNSLIGAVAVSRLDGVPLATGASRLNVLIASVSPDALAASAAETF